MDVFLIDMDITDTILGDDRNIELFKFADTFLRICARKIGRARICLQNVSY